MTPLLSPTLSRLPRSFYLRPTVTVAMDLLGRYLIRRIGRTLLIGKIVEVEAYLGELDPASHAYRGRTKRNEVMFERGGHLYVYFTYGMHFCCNVVTEERDRGRAVLLRAVEPVRGVGMMARHRGIALMGRQRGIGDGPAGTARKSLHQLTNGPAKLCEAFRIGREQNGTDLMGRRIFLTRGEKIQKSEIATSVRIGISGGKDKRWRFYVRGNPFVSR